MDWLACNGSAILMPNGPQNLAAHVANGWKRKVLMGVDVGCITVMLISMFLEFAVLIFYLLVVIRLLKKLG